MNNNEIETYIIQLQKEEARFKKQKIEATVNQHHEYKFSRYFNLFGYSFLSFCDFVLLWFGLIINLKKFRNKKIVYTANNFCTENNGELEDRIVKPLFTDNILFINQSKVSGIKKVNGQKVYNLGGLVKVVSLFLFDNDSRLMKIFRAYSLVNNSILKNLKGNELYMLWFYDLNSLSLIFSKYRKNVKLIEVQHGSIINYPPYSKPAPIKIADLFYVKNIPTIEYLKSHLCLNHPSEYKIIPYPENNRKYIPGVHLLYASTVEFNGLHPAFRKFLSNNQNPNLHVLVRLHPRERDKELQFRNELDKYTVKFEFDHSKNWLEGNSISNLIIISPWSSTLEDAYDNGFIAVTIDPVGKERFKHLLDNKRFFFAENIEELLKSLDI